MNRGVSAKRGPAGGERQITGRMVLIALLGFFGFVMLVNIVMVRAAITTFGGVDTPSSYRAGLAFTNEARRANAQEIRAWDVTGEVARTAEGASLTFHVRDAGHRPVTGADLVARLNHPIDERRDIAIAVSEIGSGAYSGRVAAAPGRWTLAIEISKDGERLFRSHNRVTIE